MPLLSSRLLMALALTTAGALACAPGDSASIFQDASSTTGGGAGGGGAGRADDAAQPTFDSGGAVVRGDGSSDAADPGRDAPGAGVDPSDGGGPPPATRGATLP